MAKVYIVFTYGDEWKSTDTKSVVMVWTGKIGRKFFEAIAAHSEDLGLWDGVDATELEKLYERGGMMDVTTRLDYGGIEIFNANEWEG